MNEVLYFGGIFNYTDPLFGWQLYKWGWIFIIVLSVVVWLGFRYGSWEKYKAVWGLFDAFKAESQAAFIFNAGLVSELVSERVAKCIFDYSKIKYKGLNRLQSVFFNYATVYLDDLSPAKAIVYKLGGRNMDVEIAKRLQNYKWEKHSSVTIGGIHTDIVLDADNWTIPSSPQHKAIEAQCEVHNDANPTDQIHSYSEYQKRLLDRSLPCPHDVISMMVVPWKRIDSAFPINVDNNQASGAKRQYAREMEEQENNSLAKFYLPMLVGGLGFSILLLSFRMAIKLMG